MSQQVWSGLGLDSEVSIRPYHVMSLRRRQVGRELLYLIWASALMRLIVGEAVTCVCVSLETQLWLGP